MNITLKQLKIFEAVAETKSYTRAAEKLNMTQPAVSMQMKQLEEIIGVELFERQGRKIVITKVGNKMREHEKKILKRYSNLQDYLNVLKNIDEKITISAATTANHFVTHMMADFSRLHPKVNIALDITNREALVNQLQNYDPDFVIMGEPPKKLDLGYQQIMANPLVVIASVDHPFVKNNRVKPISMEDINRMPFVVREEGSGTKAAIRRHFKDHKLNFVSSYEMSSNESIKHAVVAGLGLGIVALHTIKLELEAKKLVILNVENFPLERHWNLVSRKGKRLSPMALKFQEFILKTASSYQQSYRHVMP